MGTTPDDAAGMNGQADGGRQHPSTDEAAAQAHEGIDSAAQRSAQAEREMRADAAEAERELRAAADEARRELRGAAEEVADRAREAEAQFESALDANIEKVKAYVRKNPMASAGLAFVAGLLVSSLMKR